MSLRHNKKRKHYDRGDSQCGEDEAMYQEMKVRKQNFDEVLKGASHEKHSGTQSLFDYEDYYSECSD